MLPPPAEIVPPGLSVILPVTEWMALGLLLKPSVTVNAPFPPIVSLPVTLRILLDESNTDEPKAAPVESGAAPESRARSLVILRVPPLQLNRDGTPPTLIAPTFAVPDC